MKKAIITVLAMFCISMLPVHALNDFEALQQELGEYLLENDPFMYNKLVENNPSQSSIQKPKMELRLHQDKKEDYEAFYKKFVMVNEGELSEEQRLDLQLYFDTFDIEMLGDIHAYSYQFALSNPINQMYTDFLNYQFYSTQSIDDYISLLNSAKSYVTSIMTQAEKELNDQKAANKEMFTQAKSDLETIVNAGIDPFIHHFNYASASLQLTSEESENYRNRVVEAVNTNVFPALQDLLTKFPSYIEMAHSGTIFQGEEGRKGFENIVNGLFGKSYKGVSEYKSDLSMYIYNLSNEYDKYANIDADPSFYTFDSVETIVNQLHDKLKEAPLVQTEVPYQIKNDPSLNNLVSYEYPFTYYTNDTIEQKNFDDLKEIIKDTIPGEMYLHALNQNKRDSIATYLLSPRSYTEGWRLYIGDVADTWLLDPSLHESAKALDKRDELILMLLAYADVQVNGYTMDKETFTQSIKDEFIVDDEIISYLYDRVTVYPIRYFVGSNSMRMFKEMKQMCINSLGEKFDETKFHEIILAKGPRYLPHIYNDIYDYIDENTQTPTPSAKAASQPTPMRKSDMLVFGGVAIGVIAIGCLIVLMGNRKK